MDQCDEVHAVPARTRDGRMRLEVHVASLNAGGLTGWARAVVPPRFSGSPLACGADAPMCTGMKTDHKARSRTDLVVAVLLARLLDKLETAVVAPDAGQYRSVVQHLSDELERLPHDAALDALLETVPAAADLYENLNYRHAGLCRAPLETAARAETLARDAIAAIRETSRQGPPRAA